MDDWDRKPKEPSSIWLKLKSKGDSIRIRIAAAPYREAQVWPSERGGQRIDQETVNSFTAGQWMSIMRNPDYQISEVYHLLVIDRADGLAKIYQASGAVYGKIRDYAKNQEWGNPMGYDISVERTEVPGSYWKITPSPNKSDLMSSERALVDAILDKLPAGALPASGPQPDDIGDNVAPEPLPWEPVQSPQAAVTQAPPAAPAAEVTDNRPLPKPGEEDIVIEDIGDEPVNLDDIPF